jgi:hypothetical protein
MIWNRKLSFGEVLLVVVVAVMVLMVVVPMPNPGRREAPTTQCITNMHNLAMALQHYQMDYSSYPETLGGHVKTDSFGNIVPFEQVKQASSLYPEYIITVKGYHCPKSSVMTKTDRVVEVSVSGKIQKYYAYDNYDVYCGNPEDDRSPIRVGPEALRYARSWAADSDDVSRFAVYDTKDTAELRAHDFNRQLKWSDAPKDSVVTWCSYHAQRSSDMIPVLFKDGHCDKVLVSQIEGKDGRGGSRWRTIPKL